MIEIGPRDCLRHMTARLSGALRPELVAPFHGACEPVKDLVLAH